jgi:hypothetical protein
MKVFALVGAALLASLAHAEKILLIPLDSRPASGQFAQMIGDIAGADVRMPPYEALGRFTTSGNPDRALSWLESQDLHDVTAVVASLDTISYGGLIQSRSEGVPVSLALARVDRLVRIVRRSPHTKLYAFSSIMRLVPTATTPARPWRMHHSTYFEMRDKWLRTGDKAAKRKMAASLPLIPKAELDRYQRTRKRNHEVQKGLVARARQRAFDYLVFGQDDAKAYGPFVAETAVLKKLSHDIGGMVFFCEGIDQHAAVLVSRALLKEHEWAPRVRVLFSDDAGRAKYASYESKPVESSLRDQLLASGARIAGEGEPFDYTLYLNTPQPRRAPFDAWLRTLIDDLDQNRPVAVADINLASDGTGDAYLWAWLRDRSRMMRLLSYAAWNTAGNTMGTAIPSANVYMLARRIGVDALHREVAQKKFLLHRLVNDYAYHKFTRPIAYQLIDADPAATREETYGTTFHEINDFVRRDTEKQLQRTFEQQFRGRRFMAGDKEYEFTEVADVKVVLPWPRAYEVRLSFDLTAQPVATTAQTSGR